MKSKKIFFALLAVSCFSQVVWAYPHHGHRPGGGRSGYRPGHGHRTRCSPEMKQSTVSAVEGVLSDASVSPEFQNATYFQEFVRQTASLMDADQKMHSYLSVVGVDSNDATAVAEFVGARDRSSYVSAAEKSLRLTPTQADVLVQKFTEAAMSVITL